MYTEENIKTLKEMIADAAISNWSIKTKFGTYLTAQDLLHNASTDTVQALRKEADDKLSKTTTKRSWGDNSYDEVKRLKLQNEADLLYYIEGYKIWKAQSLDIQEKLEKVRAEKEKLRQDTMTPEQKIADLDSKEKELMAKLGMTDGSTNTSNEEAANK